MAKRFLSNMKKTYISPEFLLIELRCSNMLAESVALGGGSASGGNGGWAKESTPITDKSVWDEEW